MTHPKLPTKRPPEQHTTHHETMSHTTTTTTPNHNPSNHNPSNHNHNHKHPSPKKKLQKLFDRVSTLIRDTPPTPSNAVSDHTKLRLYGLYKRVTTGPTTYTNDNDNDNDNDNGGWKNNHHTPSNPPHTQRPSLWNPIERYKYDAWEACDGMDTDDAALEYVRVAAGEENDVGRLCKSLFEEFRRSEERKEEGDIGSSGDGGDGREETKDDDGTQDDDSVGSFHTHTPTIHTLPSSQPSNQQQQPSIRSQSSVLERSFGIQPFLPRGRPDLSYSDLAHAAWHSLKPWLLPQPFGEAPSRAVSRLETSIVTAWQEQATSIVPTTTKTNTNDNTNHNNNHTNTDPNAAVVGLSVRSLFDLFLTVRSYPPESEIIFVPPLNVEWMVRIVQYHNLTVVPVDLPPSPVEEKGEGEGEVDPIVAIDFDAVRNALSDRTVAIVVVHPFGMLCASHDDMKKLNDLLRTEEDRRRHSYSSSLAGNTNGNDSQKTKRSIDILEDCSECYDGGGYGGSSHADVSFFSFGTIKTSTALGGGIAVFPRWLNHHNHHHDTNNDDDNNDDNEDHDDRNQSVTGIHKTVCEMRRVQDTRYEPQSPWEYFQKVVKVALLLFLSRHIWLCGMVVAVLEGCGIDYERLVTSSVRGFHIDDCDENGGDGVGRRRATATTTRNGTNSFDRQTVERARNRLVLRQIRRKPCPALLSLLLRRIRQSDVVRKTVSSRIARCTDVERRLIRLGGSGGGGSGDRCRPNGNLGRPVGREGRQNLYWLCPILVDKPDVVSRSMKEMGFDVPRGLSQLDCVTSFLDRWDGESENVNECPRAKRMMERVLYLPIASQDIPKGEVQKLVEALAVCTSSGGGADGGHGHRRHGTVRTNGCGRTYAVVIAASVLGGILLVVDRFTFRLLLTIRPVNALWLFGFVLRSIVPVALSVLFVVLWFLHVLRVKMGPYYIDSSKTFARYCGSMALLDGSRTFPSEGDGNDDDNTPIVSMVKEEDIFKMDGLRIPDLRDSSFTTVENRTVILAGATGFIGSLLLRDLLFYRESLCIEGGVILIVRSKRGVSASERIKRLLNKPIYDFLSDLEKENLVKVVEGDLCRPNLGLSRDDAELLHSKEINVSHVIDCAACVAFTEPLDVAAASNITSALQLRALAEDLPRSDVSFVYVSTAFVHGGETGSVESPLPQRLHPLGTHNPMELYTSMVETQSYASAAMRDLGFPNTYAFSKCVCEHLLCRDGGKGVKTTIVRPCIVGPALQRPFEGWAGDKPSTLVAAACLYMKYQYNLWGFGKETAPVIPVDVVTSFILAKCFQPSLVDQDETRLEMIPSDDYVFPNRRTFPEEVPETTMCEMTNKNTDRINYDDCSDNSDARFFTIAWDSSSPSHSGFLWFDFALAVVQMGAVRGHIDRAIAYIGLFITFKVFLAVDLTYRTFNILHKTFVQRPIEFLIGLCDRVGWKPKFVGSLKRIKPFLDLPLLFFPFTKATFHFQTDLVAPTRGMNGERYMFNCVSAAERFVSAIDGKTVSKGETSNHNRIGHSSRHRRRRRSGIEIIAGRNHIPKSSDFWWAMTQPKGNYALRLIGWIVMKILRKMTTEVTVDITSFAQTQHVVDDATLRGQQDDNTRHPCIVLVPTHRSLLDFIILSFVTFSLPEVGLTTPKIAAAEEFSRIPVLGWLARAAGAFFLRRGGGVSDPDLRAQLKTLKEKENPLCVEVFLEGKRSRDRRFVFPKTGFLKCLCDTGSDHVIVPITINYEAVPDQNVLACEIDGKSHGKLSFFRLIKWIKKVWDGKVQIGRVHLSAASPLLMKPNSRSKVAKLARSIQLLQQSKICVSRYHIDVGALLLGIDSSVIQEALSVLKCPLWPQADSTDTVKSPCIPCLEGERWSIFLHYGHYFAPFLAKSRPEWASWLNHTRDGYDPREFDSVSIVVASLRRHFDEADNVVDDTFTWLRDKGFSRPEFDHLLQYATKINKNVAPLLLASAIRSRLNAIDQNATSTAGKPLPVKPLFQQNSSPCKSSIKCTVMDNITSMESFGAWGFRDSGFIARVFRDGTKCVSMKGDRYRMSGKQLPKLIPFLERETGLKVNTLRDTLPQAPRNITLCESGLSRDDFKKLHEVFGFDKTRLSMQSKDRARHGTGHSQEDMYMIRSGQIQEIRLPDVVVFPKNEFEVEKLVILAHKEQWCLIPFGGGTNVSHATRCPSKINDPRPMISVDMKLMNQVLKINEEDATAHVQAGIKGIDLAQHMESLGYTIGHEPDSIEFSTLGGWIATKASGMKQNKYGNIENIVKEVRVVASHGVLWQNQGGYSPSFGRVSTGIDLSSLVLGSEGSFGIITSAVIKIWPLPEVKEYDSVVMHDFNDGLRLIRDIAKMGLMKPASVRLLDNQQFRMGQALMPTDNIAHMRKFILELFGKFFASKFDPNNVVCATITFEGTFVEVKLQKQLVKNIVSRHGGFCAGTEIGKAGYDMTYAIAYLRDFAMTYGFLADSFETFVPWSSLTKMITATKQCIEREHQQRALPGAPMVSCRITQLYDEGACVYFYFCMNFTNVENPSKIFNEIETIARRVIIKMGGSLSHHHGVGKLRAPFMNTVNPNCMKKLCMALKKSIDPENVFGVSNGIYY